MVGRVETGRKVVERSYFEDQGYKVIEHESTITLEPVEHASEWVRNRRKQVALGNQALSVVMDKKER